MDLFGYEVYVQHLELSFLIRSERLPFRGVEELVAVDVMQELAFKGYVDPEREREGGDTRLKRETGIKV